MTANKGPKEHVRRVAAALDVPYAMAHRLVRAAAQLEGGSYREAAQKLIDAHEEEYGQAT